MLSSFPPSAEKPHRLTMSAPWGCGEYEQPRNALQSTFRQAGCDEQVHRGLQSTLHVCPSAWKHMRVGSLHWFACVCVHRPDPQYGCIEEEHVCLV